MDALNGLTMSREATSGHESPNYRIDSASNILTPVDFAGGSVVGSACSASSATQPVITASRVTTGQLTDRCVICQRAASLIRRKKVCVLCLQQVCVDCIPDDPRTRTHRICSICQIITCNLTTRNQLEKLRTQHLVRFVDANRFDRRTCQDKTELIELILRRAFNPQLNSTGNVASNLNSSSLQRQSNRQPHIASLASNCTSSQMGNSTATGSHPRNHNAVHTPNGLRQNERCHNSNSASTQPNTSTHHHTTHRSGRSRTNGSSQQMLNRCGHNVGNGTAFSFSCNTGTIPNWFNGLQQTISTFANGMTSFVSSANGSATPNFPNFTFTQTQSNQPNAHRAHGSFTTSVGTGANIPAFTSTTMFNNTINTSNLPQQTTTTTTTRMTFGQAQQQSTGSNNSQSDNTRGQARPGEHRQTHRRSGIRTHGTPTATDRNQTSTGRSNEDNAIHHTTPRPPSPPIPSILLVQLKCREDIDRMSTKQMKELLNFHLVSIRGCLEQSELRDKVLELWEDEKEKRRIRDQSEQSADTEGRHMCKVCMGDVVDCVLVECGHMVTCLDCGKKLQKCPICRQDIIRVIKTFRS